RPLVNGSSMRRWLLILTITLWIPTAVFIGVVFNERHNWNPPGPDQLRIILPVEGKQGRISIASASGKVLVGIGAGPFRADNFGTIQGSIELPDDGRVIFNADIEYDRPFRLEIGLEGFRCATLTCDGHGIDTVTQLAAGRHRIVVAL